MVKLVNFQFGPASFAKTLNFCQDKQVFYELADNVLGLKKKKTLMEPPHARVSCN